VEYEETIMSALMGATSDPGIAPVVLRSVDCGTDLVEYYFDQGWTDGLPVVPPTPEKVATMVEALGGDPQAIIARIPPRWGGLNCESTW